MTKQQHLDRVFASCADLAAQLHGTGPLAAVERDRLPGQVTGRHHVLRPTGSSLAGPRPLNRVHHPVTAAGFARDRAGQGLGQ